MRVGLRSVLAVSMAVVVTGCAGALRGGTIGQDHPQPAPQYRAVGLVVLDPLARPIVNASCGLAGATDQGRVSNADGYILFATVSTTLRATQLTCAADGFLPFSEHRDLTTSANEDLAPAMLTPVMKPRPTREQVTNIRANFFGPRDGRGRIVFDPVLAVLSPNEREEWYAQKQAEHLTHVAVAPAFAYPGFPSFDWWNEPAKFMALLIDVLDHGFTPVVQLAEGDHFRERNSAFNSNPALTDHLVREIRRFLPELADVFPYAVWSPGWEVIGPPEYWWTAYQLVTVLDTMASILGPEAVVGVHAQPNRVTGASYCGTSMAQVGAFGACVAVSQNPDGTWNYVEPDDPSRGDEIGFFSLPAGRRINLWLFQMDHDRHMADPGLSACSSAYGRVCETLRRWLPPALQTSALTGASAPGPQWFRVGQGPRFCAFETGALNVKNGDFGPEALTLIAQRLEAIGVTCFGNGVPR
jgi:hypothetical protein